ncbi:hypothetical protein K505DRAFT_31076 [Melanomma pulvis-pyrius CBS 109.77]|uniref:Zn(2)-C6 fungal-type domain-containing protein n=1 Tax=Melanomma pulvis-pyrius CBS 109.77 TaxID=1314802 RepID=A0A6A6XCC3_9PLEO|nr:hypothetical protein K505DRAFT_31076 [Melanomma pulvis-pyrius CBS 109.77]
MAIGVDLPARKSASRLDQPLLGRPGQSSAMSYHPSPHISGPGLPSADTVNIPSSEERFDRHPTLPGQGLITSPHQHSNKKRRPSKGKVPPEIRRSSSTPHMHNLALSTSGELSPTDKRRNKLGYHRTSVACGHCRRRKIRCLVANEDPGGRCANCIRLKKECNFYPVEQNPETQRSHTGSAKETSIGAPASSTTSSPLHPASNSSEKVDDFRPPFNATTPGTLAPRYGVPPDTEVESPRVPQPSGMHMQHPPYPYPPPIETQWPPTTGFLPSSSVVETSPSSSTYWRPSPSTANSAYGSDSNVSGGHTPAAMSATSNLSYGSHHDGPSWGPPNLQPPTRSMSYGNIEGLPQHYSNQGLGIQSHDFPRRTSPYPYPTSLDTNPSTLRSTTLGSSTAAPLSAPIVTNQQYTYPPTWSPYGGMQNPAQEMHMQARSMSGQWYPEPGQLDQVQEEGGPPMTYSHHGVPQYYSGP